MYRIIGADGKEYGPVPLDELRRWIAEGRADASTRVAAEGTAEWRTLGSIPEFSYLLAASASARTGFSTPAPQRSNPMAVTSLVMGILSIVSCVCCYGFPFNLLGVIFSIIGLSQIRRDPHLYTGKGAAITGLVLSLLSIVIAIGFLVFVGLTSDWSNMSRPPYQKL